MRLVVEESQGMVLHSFLSPYTSTLNKGRSTAVVWGKQWTRKSTWYYSDDTAAIIQQHLFFQLTAASGTGFLLRFIYSILLSLQISE